MPKSRGKSSENHKEVIPLQEDYGEWRFFDYTTTRNQIDAWLETVSEDARNTFNSLLKNARKIRNPRDWGERRDLKGAARRHKIWELRFSADGRAYRVLGVTGSLRKSAILLIGCFHKQGVYQPAECIETAIDRKGRLERGEATAVERTIRDDL